MFGQHADRREQMRRTLSVSAQEASLFARMSGDMNAIHHDESGARAAGFDSIVLSGTQLSALLMGLTATHFSRPGPAGDRTMLGLEFRFRFRRAVLAGEPIELAWDVVAVQPKPTLRGDLVLLAGRILNAAGEQAVRAVGKVLVRAAQ